MDQDMASDNFKFFYNIMELFEQKKLVKICAPMVRYSKFVTFSYIDCNLSILEIDRIY